MGLCLWVFFRSWFLRRSLGCQFLTAGHLSGPLCRNHRMFRMVLGFSCVHTSPDVSLVFFQWAGSEFRGGPLRAVEGRSGCCLPHFLARSLALRHHSPIQNSSVMSFLCTLPHFLAATTRATAVPECAWSPCFLPTLAAVGGPHSRPSITSGHKGGP